MLVCAPEISAKAATICRLDATSAVGRILFFDKRLMLYKNEGATQNKLFSQTVQSILYFHFPACFQDRQIILYIEFFVCL